MTRRITLGLVAALALLLTACEINVDYDLLLHSDGSSEMQTDIVYDEAAAEMLGPPSAFLDEVEADTGGDIPGVRVIDSSADDSDPDAQRVSVTLAADDAAGLDALVRDSFAGSFTHQGDDVYELFLRAEDASMDGEMDIGMDFMSGSMVVRHDGQRDSVSGGDEVDSQTVNWDPFGPQDLRMVVDLGAGGSAGSAGFAFGLGTVLLIVLGLLALVIIGVVVFLVVRRSGGEAPPASAGPMTGPMAGEVDAMQTPPAGGAAWGGSPQQPHPQPGNWDQQAQPSTPAADEPSSPEPSGGWDHPAPQQPSPSPEPTSPPDEQQPGPWAPPAAPGPPQGDTGGGTEDGTDRRDPPPPTP